jgi:hypothetical protein
LGVDAVIVGALALGAVLAAFRRKLWAPAAGALLVLCGIVAFAVFPFRRGFDLAIPLASLGVGLLILAHPARLPGSWSHTWGLRLALGVAPLLVFGGFIVTLHEMDEVVELRTTDEDGDTRRTRVAVLDHEGSVWVGAGPTRRWAGNMRARPRVELVRGGESSCRLAMFEEDPEVRLSVLSGLEAKYRIARFMAALGSPLWLRPADASGAEVAAVRLAHCAEAH